jgi:putative PIG3 family NAD(P)H quinone oxidoreductase
MKFLNYEKKIDFKTLLLKRKIRSKMMRAVVQLIEGDEKSLVIDNIPVPQPGPREVLIKVQCAALNRLDLNQIKGSYTLPSSVSKTLGVEVSGTIAVLGDNCTLGFNLNENVMALATGGGYAEFCVVDERTIIKALPGFDMTVLAAIPEAFITAYKICFIIGNIKSGETVLLHAAASSVGQAAIQMLVRKGVTVFTTCRSDVKCARCLELGAKASFNIADITNSNTFSSLVINANNGHFVDVVLDPIGSSYINENINSLTVDGRLVLYGLMSGGAIQDSTFLSKLLMKRISLLPTTLRFRSIEFKENIVNLLQTDVDGFSAIQSGEIKVDVDKTFSFENVLEAHDYMRNNKNIGKIVLLIN